MEKQFKYATFNYNSEDEKLVEMLGNYLDERGQDIYNFFNNPCFKRCNIKIINTKEEFDEIVKKIRNNGKDVPKWVIGITTFDEIIYLSLSDYKNTSHKYQLKNYDEALDYYKKTIVHEFVHFVNNLYCDGRNKERPLKCLLEGVALNISGQRDNYNGSFDYSIDDILGNNPCYDGWYLVVKYILDNYDKEYLLSLFDNNSIARINIIDMFPNIKDYYKNKTR